jgi:hypothetical protein
MTTIKIQDESTGAVFVPFTVEIGTPIRELKPLKPIDFRAANFRSVSEITRTLGDDECDCYGLVSADQAARNRLRHKIRHILQLDV